MSDVKCDGPCNGCWLKIHNLGDLDSPISGLLRISLSFHVIFIFISTLISINMRYNAYLNLKENHHERLWVNVCLAPLVVLRWKWLDLVCNFVNDIRDLFSWPAIPTHNQSFNSGFQLALCILVVGLDGILVLWLINGLGLSDAHSPFYDPTLLIALWPYCLASTHSTHSSKGSGGGGINFNFWVGFQLTFSNLLIPCFAKLELCGINFRTESSVFTFSS